MTLAKHKLTETTLDDVQELIPKEMNVVEDLSLLLKDKPMSTLQRYQLNSFIKCSNMVTVFVRLGKVADMTGRSVYLRKGEDKNEVLKEWMIYHYGFYVSIYQGVVDIAFILVNQILDLGFPLRNCNSQTLCSNEHVKGTGIDKTLQRIEEMTNKHRESKNLLLHRGEEVVPPAEIVSPSVFDIPDLVKKMGLPEDIITAYLKEFLALKNKEQLMEKMRSECGDLEINVERLFNELLPHY